MPTPLNFFNDPTSQFTYWAQGLVRGYKIAKIEDNRWRVDVIPRHDENVKLLGRHFESLEKSIIFCNTYEDDTYGS
jgi:hypothetical protein